MSRTGYGRGCGGKVVEVVPAGSWNPCPAALGVLSMTTSTISFVDGRSSGSPGVVSAGTSLSDQSSLSDPSASGVAAVKVGTGAPMVSNHGETTGALSAPAASTDTTLIRTTRSTAASATPDRMYSLGRSALQVTSLLTPPPWYSTRTMLASP